MPIPIVRPRPLQPGDNVRLVSPASTPDEGRVQQMVALLERRGLRVQLGRHILDRYGYLAGRDEDRLSDLDDAIRDGSVRAIIATRGGKGAYRLADRLDFEALRADPKLLVGFSETTILHLAIWQRIQVPGLHGACWSAEAFGERAEQSICCALMTADTVTVRSDPREETASLTTTGQACGILLGGNLDMIATAAGWALPNLNGAILLIEDSDKGLGQIDRNLTRLLKSGALAGIRGVAVGQFTGFTTSKGVTVVELLRERLTHLAVPILGGLPLGHGANPLAVPVGTQAVLDAEGGTLSVKAAFA